MAFNMGDRKEYAPFSIPRRETQSEETPGSDRIGSSPLNAKTPGVNHTFVSDAQPPLPDTQLPKDDSLFAEIEYKPNASINSASAQALRFFSSNRDMADRDSSTRGAVTASQGAGFTQAQPIVQREIDPIREKFFEMRSLASDRPFARNDSELFYRQAKFMENFTDDYSGSSGFSMYYPYYQHMGYDQLRTYFTWRTRVRRGEISPTAASYAFLYVYELLSGIGADGPADGLNQLVRIWDDFLEYGPALTNYMLKWFKDYHIFYELPRSFADFIEEHNLQKHYSLTLLFDTGAENAFDIWNSISAYDVTQSRFYSDGNERLFKDCFSAVLRGLGEFCGRRGKSLEELFIYKVSNRVAWYPFSQALFYNRIHQADRQVTLPGRERYYCKNDRWTANLPIYYSNHKDYAGYILKKTESCLRQVVKYKYKLTAELKVRNGYNKESAVTGTQLDGVIEDTVADFYRDINRTVVTVDHVNLARIRKEALGTQDKLIVPEDSAVALPSNKEIYTPDIQDGADIWTALKYALSAVELEALSLALRGGEPLKSFADENGIMLEVLVDAINEKAADCIGDNVIEMNGDVKIYDEYKENVAIIAGK